MLVRLHILNKWLLRNSVVFWLFGLLIPHLYLLFITSILKIKKTFIDSNLFVYLLIFLLIQILSLCGSFFYPFFSWIRFAGAIHNIAVFLFIFSGINFVLTFGVLETSQIAKVIFKWIVLLVTIFSILSLTFKIYFSYPGLLAFLDVNKYTMVKMNGYAWYIFDNFPRASVYGIYPNSTGLLLTILYPIQKFNKPKLGLLDFLFVFACFMTGSRIFLMISIIQVCFLFFKNKSRFLFILVFIPLILSALMPYLYDLYLLREGSNIQRMEIYSSSINLMLQTNPIIGVGIKPFIEDLTMGGHYPLGSHSTLIGYFFKNGLLGGIYILCGYLFIFARFIVYIIQFSFFSKIFERSRFLLEASFVLIVISSLLEDFDAYEPIMLYFGILIGSIMQIDKNQKLSS